MASTNRYMRPLAILLGLGLLVALLIPLATRGTRADQQTLALPAGKQLTITCETSLSGTVQGQQAVIECAPQATPVPTAAAAAPQVTEIAGVSEGQALSGRVNIEAKVAGDNIARVVFKLDGPQPAIHTEKVAPYFFLGDDKGTPRGWDTTTFANGDYTMTVTAFDQSGQQGQAAVHFSVANNAAPPPAPTNTAVPATAVPPTAVPPTAVPPTATPAGGSGGQEQPVAGQPCPTWVHDRYVAKGPDGKMYPTWHPAVDPQYQCTFGHEHGRDPSTCKANTAPPLFGYVGSLAGLNEPHEGFKVFCINAGDTSDNGRKVPADFRVVFHFGTARTGRYTQQFHSVQYDYIARDGSGREAHVAGMADTFNHAGSTCDNPRVNGRDFSTIGCNDPYEIWSWGFDIKHPDDPYQDVMHVRLHIGGAVASFDPITTRDPSDSSKLVYTQDYRRPNSGIDPTSPQADFQGCQREMYGGPNYWNNSGKPTTYYTDPFGNVKAGPGPGLIEQRVSAVNSTNNEQYKYRQDFCGNGIHFPN